MECETRIVCTDRSSALFLFVVDWLSSYTIFPLAQVGGMSHAAHPSQTLQRRRLFGLNKLEEAIDNAISPDLNPKLSLNLAAYSWGTSQLDPVFWRGKRVNYGS